MIRTLFIPPDLHTTTTQMSTSTQPATSTVEYPRFPNIPPELISLILIKLWEAPLSSYERSASWGRIALVSRTWLTLIAPIASRDAHIFQDKWDVNAFLGRIYKYSIHKDLFSSEAGRFANEICRFLTIHANGNGSRGGLSGHTPDRPWDSKQTHTALGSIMYMTQEPFNYLPNLGHILLLYRDWAYDDFLTQSRMIEFPKQVTHLSIDYSFTAPASAPAFESATIQRSPQPCTRRYYEDYMHIRQLSLSGMTKAFVAFILPLYSNVETLEIASPAQLGVLAPLPPTVRTLALCHPGVAVSRETMASWKLDTALDAGLIRELRRRGSSSVRAPLTLLRLQS